MQLLSIMLPILAPVRFAKLYTSARLYAESLIKCFRMFGVFIRNSGKTVTNREEAMLRSQAFYPTRTSQFASLL
jgi:hypothetical protein